MKTKILMTSVSLLMLGGIFQHTETNYFWDSYTVRGNVLYAMKVTDTLALDVPIPEHSPRKVLAKSYKVVAIDLSGSKKNFGTVKFRLEPKKPGTIEQATRYENYYSYIEVNESGETTLVGRKELKERLMRAEGVACSAGDLGDVIYDVQDSRVLYLACRRREIAYRFEPPYLSASVINLGSPLRVPPSEALDFFSALGQKKVFVSIDRECYEIDTGPNELARKLESIEANSIGPSDRSAKSLIGVADGVRIYQLTQLQKTTTQVLIEYENQPPREYALPKTLVTSIATKAVYLPQNRLILWEVKGEVIGKTVMYTLMMETGEIRRVVVADTE